MKNPTNSISGNQQEFKKKTDLLDGDTYANLNKVKSFLENHSLNRKSKEQFAASFLSGLAKEIEIVQGLFLIYQAKTKQLNFLASYAGPKRDPEDYIFDVGEGFPGQVAADRKTIILNELPETYLNIKTGLGEAKPKSLLVMPVQVRTKLIGIIELASFKGFSDDEMKMISNLTDYIAEEMIRIKKVNKEAY